MWAWAAAVKTKRRTRIKSEIRRPKSERRPNPEIRIERSLHCSDFGLLSDFGFRISDFENARLIRLDSTHLHCRNHPAIGPARNGPSQMLSRTGLRWLGFSRSRNSGGSAAGSPGWPTTNIAA